MGHDAVRKVSNPWIIVNTNQKDMGIHLLPRSDVDPESSKLLKHYRIRTNSEQVNSNTHATYLTTKRTIKMDDRPFCVLSPANTHDTCLII